MSKEHFPVNDKSIADVNAANAKAYDASIQVGPNMGATGKEKEKLMRPSEREKRGIPQEGAEIVIGKKKSSGDHVRESSQEKGEQQRDASKAETKKAAAHTGLEPHSFKGPGNVICQSENCAHTKNHPIHIK